MSSERNLIDYLGLFALWGIWLVFAQITFETIKRHGGVGNYLTWQESRDFLFQALVLLGLVLWLPARQISKFFKKSKGGNNNFSLGQFLLINILAPIIVSTVVFYLTGESSITLVSVPLAGIFSANLNIG